MRVIPFVLGLMMFSVGCGRQIQVTDTKNKQEYNSELQTEATIHTEEQTTQFLTQEYVEITEKQEDKMMVQEFDFTAFPNVNITGIRIEDLDKTEQQVLYQAARYCQAMMDADITTMREIVAEDKTFTHMSGRVQTREEYFADIANGSLHYFTIGMENPTVTVNGNQAVVSYTSVLNANAYGARGTYRMSGNHYYEQKDGIWYAVNP